MLKLYVGTNPNVLLNSVPNQSNDSKIEVSYEKPQNRTFTAAFSIPF